MQAEGQKDVKEEAELRMRCGLWGVSTCVMLMSVPQATYIHHVAMVREWREAHKKCETGAKRPKLLFVRKAPKA